jgi:hypothetical protein
MKQRRRAEALRREVARWATLTPGQRLAEREAAERAMTKRAIATMIDNLERTGALRG